MTSLDANADESARAGAHVEVEEVTPEAAATGPVYGDPTGLGLACFIMGAVALGLSLVGVVLWGSLSGSMLPFVLKRFKADPAASSAPFVATLVDVTGLVIYFTIAYVVLRGILL